MGCFVGKRARLAWRRERWILPSGDYSVLIVADSPCRLRPKKKPRPTGPLQALVCGMQHCGEALPI